MTHELKTALPTRLLTGAGDWYIWKTTIKELAEQGEVWQYIDPDLIKPLELVIPADVDPRLFVEREVELPALTNEELEQVRTKEELRAKQLGKLSEDEATAALTVTSKFNFRMALGEFDSKLKKYNVKKQALRAVHAHIFNTAGKYATLLCDLTTPFERMKTLKHHVAPTELIIQQETRREYLRVLASATNTKTEEWLESWDQALRAAQVNKLPEVVDIRPFSHFLEAVKPLAESFATYWELELQERTYRMILTEAAESLPDGYTIARLYREHRASNQSRPTQSSSFTVQRYEPTLRGESAPKTSFEKDRHCPIKGYKHDQDACYILNPGLRLEGLEERLSNTKKVSSLLGKRLILMKKYARVVEELKGILDNTGMKESGNDPDQEPPDERHVRSAAAHVHGVNAVSSTAGAPYQLRDSVLMGSGSVIHVTNDRKRLINFHDCKPEEVFSGTDLSYITGWGSMDVMVDGPKGKGSVHLKRVAYIEGFHTSLVSMHLLEKGGYWYHGQKQLIIDRQSEALFAVQKLQGQYVLEYNPLDTKRETTEEAPPK